jgi:type IV secretory pathway protease TraF
MRGIDLHIRIMFGAGATVALAFTAAVVIAGQLGLVVRNISASLPEGWYVRVSGPLQTGSLVTFRLPRSMDPYAASVPAMQSFFRDHPLLKPIAGLAGDTICRDDQDIFSIYGTPLAVVLRAGPSGHPLPAWHGCHVLAEDEIAVFSTRIPDSIDSRLFGAVPIAEVTGTYRPLWVE